MPWISATYQVGKRNELACGLNLYAAQAVEFRFLRFLPANLFRRAAAISFFNISRKESLRFCR